MKLTKYPDPLPDPSGEKRDHIPMLFSYLWNIHSPGRCDASPIAFLIRKVMEFLALLKS